MVGFGGIYVEVLKDTVTRLDPLSQGEALEMLDELRMAPLLRGVRESRQSTGPRSPRRSVASLNSPWTWPNCVDRAQSAGGKSIRGRGH
jgi:hypothetical protein